MAGVRLQDPEPEDVLLPPAGPARLTDVLKVKLLQCLCGQNHVSCTRLIAQFDAYFQFLSAECRSSGTKLPTKTFRHLLALVHYVKVHKSKPRKELLEFFDSNPCSPDASEVCQQYAAIDLAVRLLLMIRVNGTYPSGAIGLRTNIFWPADWSLEQVITELFSCHLPNALEKPRWPHMLNARTLEHIGNFKIVWTDDLQDHLLLDEDDRSIRFYHHATVLNAFVSGTADGCLPKDLLAETLQTLALLLPSRVNRDCKRWFERQLQAAEKQRGLVDPQAGNQILHLEGRLPRTYKYWGERLSIIKNALDEAEPSTLYQWWTDKRKGVQRWTFWLAAIALLLTVFLGLAQTLLAACQVYLMFNPPTR